MIQGKAWIVVLVTLIVGFGAGFVLRPVIMPARQAVAIAPAPPPAEPRAVEFFAAHLDEARQIVAGCQAGSVRGGECANAEQAVTEAEGKDRFRRFTGK
tara:strand:+ start:449 stop:745 length:297 start_codon:yes stop_codon:yes gene_type:complete